MLNDGRMPTGDQKAFLARAIAQGRGIEPADLAIRNVGLLDIVSGAIATGDIAICGDRIVGTHQSYSGRQELDGRGLFAVPGFIDTHLHVESSLVTPLEFDRCVLPHGVTTAICDPHEIANVLGIEGIRYFLAAAEATVMDLRIQLSSCVPATAFEMARVLDHSFKYYRRSQLQDLSLEGKLRAVSTLLRNNVPMAVQGIGAVAPVFAGYDMTADTGKIFFYDMLGAEFEGVEYAVSGSGSLTIRGILYYLQRWGPRRLHETEDTEAIGLALRLLESAAEFDAATGGVKTADDLYPIVKVITRDGIATLSQERLQRCYAERVASRHV